MKSMTVEQLIQVLTKRNSNERVWVTVDGALVVTDDKTNEIIDLIPDEEIH
jgi:hypothetical protein